MVLVYPYGPQRSVTNMPFRSNVQLPMSLSLIQKEKKVDLLHTVCQVKISIHECNKEHARWVAFDGAPELRKLYHRSDLKALIEQVLQRTSEAAHKRFLALEPQADIAHGNPLTPLVAEVSRCCTLAVQIF